MNRTLQTEIRAFIGDDPAKAVERVRRRILEAQRLTGLALAFTWNNKLREDALLRIAESRIIQHYSLAAYGAALSDIINGGVYETLALAATASADTRIAAMLWAAAWIVEVTE